MSSHSYGRSNRLNTGNEEEEDELERYRRDYLNAVREEEEKRKEHEAFEANVIEVNDLETYAKDNAEKHNTKEFENLLLSRPPLIVRRGQPFYICIRFKRQYDLSEDSIVLQFAIGANSRADKGTLILLPITNKKAFTKPVGEWDVRLHHEEPNIMHLQIQISSKASVGVWKFHVISSNPKAKTPREYDTDKTIYILFNPWCKDDAVYMENEANRKEYVMNDIGKLFYGTYKQPGSRRWVFGQFSFPVLPGTMAILKKSKLDDIGRGSPVKVVRALAAMLNSEDDNGVILGQWQPPYDDGKKPTEWTGSSDILDKYIRNGYRPIKYGQCWVFAGVFTTVCRALGIPCRPVTNYDSAHDADDTLTIDRHFSTDGDKLIDDDSIWNFHVWNDCWMTRPDLPPGYGGWQAVDSTPQETSEGVYRAGPASVYAVKRGEIGYMYDSPFVFSEVNADVIDWHRDLSEPIGWRRTVTKRDVVGRMIVTKKVGHYDYSGDTDMEDITSEYKNLERTPEELLATRNAATHGNYGAHFELPPPGTEDVFFDMVELEKIVIGQPFSVIMHVENRSDQERRIAASLYAESVYYTGIKAHTIKHQTYRYLFKPKQKEAVVMRITADEYYDKLVDYSMMKIFAVASVRETKQTWSEEDDFAVEKPRLKLEVPKLLKVGTKFDLSITLVNPLVVKLQNCSFAIEGPGLAKAQLSSFRDIEPEETVTHTATFTPKWAGKKNILVLFNSDQLIDVQGAIELEVV